MGGGASRREMPLLLALFLTLSAAGCAGGHRASPDAGASPSVAAQTSHLSLTPTSAPAASPRFSDHFTCAFGEEPDAGGKAPVLSGPGFCDDPVLRSALDASIPWFPDPGNGRACLAIFDMLE